MADDQHDDHEAQLGSIEAQANAAAADFMDVPMFDQDAVAEQEAYAQAQVEQAAAAAMDEPIEDAFHDDLGEFDAGLDDDDDEIIAPTITPDLVEAEPAPAPEPAPQQRYEPSTQPQTNPRPFKLPSQMQTPEQPAMTATPESVSDHVRGVITSRPNDAEVTVRPEYTGPDTAGASRENRAKMAYSEGILPTGETLSFEVEAKYNEVTLKELANRDYTKTGTLGAKMDMYGLSREQGEEFRARPVRRWGHGSDAGATGEAADPGVDATAHPETAEAATPDDEAATDPASATEPTPASPAATPGPEAAGQGQTTPAGGGQSDQVAAPDTETGAYTRETEADKLSQGDTANITKHVSADIADHTSGAPDGQTSAVVDDSRATDSQNNTPTTGMNDVDAGEDDEDATTVDPKEFVEGWTGLTRTQRRRVMREIGVVPIDELDQSLDDSDKDVEEIRAQLEKVRGELDKACAERDEALADKRSYRNQVEQLQQAATPPPAQAPAPAPASNAAAAAAPEAGEPDAQPTGEEPAAESAPETEAQASDIPTNTDDLPYEPSNG